MAAKRRRKTKSPSSKVIEGVKMSKVEESLVRTAYRTARADADKMATPPMALVDDKGLTSEEVVKQLVLWFRAATPKSDLCDCSTCGGDSDSRLNACPFCGDAEVDGAVAAEPPPDGAPKPPKSEAPKEPKPPKPEAPKAEAETSAPEVETTGVEVVDKGQLTVAELDTAVMNIEELKRAAAKGIWDLGMMIKEILDTRLWRARADEAGKPSYKTFAQFCKSELGMGYSHANRLMSVASTFPKEVMERVGIAKCSIMLHVPPEARAQLADGAESRSTAELSAEARALRDGEEPRVAKGQLTVAMAPGVTVIPLMARPKSRPRKAGEKPAKSMADDPWGMEQLPNRVHVYYGLVKNKKGELELRIERRRVAKDQLFHNEPDDKEKADE